jgi:hypothetical protein
LAQQTITNGESGLITRTKLNENFTELYAVASHFRGDYDASVNVVPVSGGTGAAGVPRAGDEWYVTVYGLIDLNDGDGPQDIHPKTILKYVGNNIWKNW